MKTHLEKDGAWQKDKASTCGSSQWMEQFEEQNKMIIMTIILNYNLQNKINSHESLLSKKKKKREKWEKVQLFFIEEFQLINTE